MSRREWRLLRRLVAAGAVAAERAHPLPGLRQAPAGWQARLEGRGVLRRVDDERWYVDLPVYRRLRDQRRRRTVVLVGIGLVLIVVAMLVWFRAAGPA